MSWSASSGAAGYNVKQSTTSGGSYTVIATNFSNLTYTNTGLASGTVYYYVVSAVNSYGESANSLEAGEQTVATTVPQLNLAAGSGQLQFNWPSDHIGWRLEEQTNTLGAGLGTNWFTVSGSITTNQIFVPININSGGAFFRLVYP